jgi:hypothetical protein
MTVSALVRFVIHIFFVIFAAKQCLFLNVATSSSSSSFHYNLTINCLHLSPVLI